MSTGLKANVDGSAAIQVGGVDAITLTSAGAASFVTSPMTIQGGSVSAPSLTFSGDTNTGIFSPAADTVAIATGGTQRLTVNSSGNTQTVGTISVGNATPSTSGAGITFPATQSASTNANTLDDYEEGTFTPTAIGTSTAGTGTYTTQIGKYTKIGNSVNFTIAISWTAHTGTGSLNIAGLPFAASAGGDRYSFSIAAQLLVYTNQLVCINAGGGFTTIELYQQSSNANLSLVAMDGNVTYMVITGTYFV